MYLKIDSDVKLYSVLIFISLTLVKLYKCIGIDINIIRSIQLVKILIDLDNNKTQLYSIEFVELARSLKGGTT